ncbi:MAG: acyl carrier protein [Candidatus Binatia bacterium]
MQSVDHVDKGVREVMAAIFNLAPQSIDATASPATIEVWDSMQHLNLVLALEEHFGVQFSIDEVATLNNYPAIVTVISQHLENR